MELKCGVQMKGHKVILMLLLLLSISLVSCSHDKTLIIPTSTENSYVEGYYYNSTGGGTPYTVTLASANVWYNLTNWTAGEYNDFEFWGNGVNASKSGIYSFSGTVTFTGGNGEEYSFSLSQNGVMIGKCGMGRTAGNSVRENLAFSCLIDIEEGDHLTLEVADKNNPPTDVDIYKINMNMVKVSD